MEFQGEGVFMKFVDRFGLAVFVNCDGYTSVVDITDNFFTPMDLLRACETIASEDDSLAFKKWLIEETGCSEEDFEN